MTLVERLERLLSKPNTRLKFKEIQARLKCTSKEVEHAITKLRETRKDLVYAKFDRTFYFSNIPTWFSYSTDLSGVMPYEGEFGCVSDTHLGSTAERLDILEEAYSLFASRGIKQVFHTGDVTDGFRQYRGHPSHVKVYGNAPQAIYAIKNFPKREGITTYMIQGNHDDDHNEASIDRLSMVVNGTDYEGKHYEGRKDIIYLGPYSHTIILPQQVTMHMLHPLGGAAYALSYKQQKRSEAMDRNTRPDIQISGHYHTFSYIHFGGTHMIALPGMQDENDFFKRLGLSRSIGYTIIRYKIVKGRLKFCSPEVYMV